MLYHYSLHRSFDEQLPCAHAAKAILVFQTSKQRQSRLQPTLAAAAPVRAPARLYSGQGGTAWIDESIDIGRGDSSYGLTLAG